MPIDVHLRTNDSNQQLALTSIEKFGSADYFVASLLVSSNKFGCESRFYFDKWHAEQAIIALEQMLLGVITEAVLREEYGTDHVTFRSDGLGHILITGESNADDQCLRFTIGTDQTAIGPFITDFSAAIRP
ncbi:hypothetical protein NRB_47750 [Novosphingobium sp. 11B]